MGYGHGYHSDMKRTAVVILAILATSTGAVAHASPQVSRTRGACTVTSQSYSPTTNTSQVWGPLSSGCNGFTIKAANRYRVGNVIYRTAYVQDTTNQDNGFAAVANGVPSGRTMVGGQYELCNSSGCTVWTTTD